MNTTNPSQSAQAQTTSAPSSSVVATLLVSLQGIHDPRTQGQVRHLLSEVLLVALFAMISNCGEFSAMEQFARTQLEWIRKYIPLKNGPPSHDTFRYVFSLVKPNALLEIMKKWTGPLVDQQIMVDGKVSRGAKNPETGRSRLHLLRAWVGELGLSVGQAVCDDKTNELAVLPAFLSSLELKGTLVTIDAMAGHPEIAQQIHEAGGDWLLALKANEKEAMITVANYFRQLSGQNDCLPDGTPPAKTLHPAEIAPTVWPEVCDVYSTDEKNRGRYERRDVVVAPVTDDWFPKGFLWYGLQSAVCVIRTTMRHRHETEFLSQEVHLYLTSLKESAKKTGEVIRGHWGIENSCHHLLDVTYHEDHCQVRDGTSAHNLTIMREISAKLLKDYPLKKSIKAKRKEACLSGNFRSSVVEALFI